MLSVRPLGSRQNNYGMTVPRLLYSTKEEGQSRNNVELLDRPMSDDGSLRDFFELEKARRYRERSPEERVRQSVLTIGSIAPSTFQLLYRGQGATGRPTCLAHSIHSTPVDARSVQSHKASPGVPDSRCMTGRVY